MTGKYLSTKMIIKFMIIVSFLVSSVHGERSLQNEKNRKTFNEYVNELNNIPFETLIKNMKALNTSINCDHKMDFDDNQTWYDKHWYIFQRFYSNSDNRDQMPLFNDRKCILSEITTSHLSETASDTTNDTSHLDLNEEQEIQLLFDWSVWVVYFYMGENMSRIWFFRQMRALETAEDGGWLDQVGILTKDGVLTEDSVAALSKEQRYAKLTMYVAASIIRSINIYRRCVPTNSKSVHTELGETLSGPYIYRGIRVKAFDENKSKYPTNFQSFSMAMNPGVSSVLSHYEWSHIKSEQFTTVVVLGHAQSLIKHEMQPIQIFNGFIAETSNSIVMGAPYCEQEVLFPPFCNFDLKPFKFTDLKSRYHEELIISQLWHLNFLQNRGYQTKYGDRQKLKLLWIINVDCLTEFDELTKFESTIDPDLEIANDETLFQVPNNYRQKKKQTQSIYGRIKEFHTQFPMNDFQVYPCIRLFATHYDDITSTDVIYKQEDIEEIITELKESPNILLYSDSDKETIDINMLNNKLDDWGFEVDESTWKVTEVVDGGQASRLGIQVDWKIIKVNYQPIDEYVKTRDNMVFKKILDPYFTFEKPIEDKKTFQQIVENIWEERSIWEKLPYRRLYIKLSYFSYYAAFPSKESCRFCMQHLIKLQDPQWLEELTIDQTEENKKYSTVRICEVSPLNDADKNRFVCEFSDDTYSHNLFFPCQKTKETKKLYGIFCRLTLEE